MLCLSASDISQAVTEAELVDCMERAMVTYAHGEFLMPLRTQVDYGHNTLLLMPCFTGEAFGTKLVTVFPDAVQHDAPVINGVMVLNDILTGRPLAVLNGQVLTGMRTGAVGSVSLRYLAPVGTRHLGIIGAGVQGYYQALFATTVLDIAEIYVFDIFPEKMDSWIARLRAQRPEVQIHRAASPAEVVAASEVIITATTSRTPVLPNDRQLLAGKHFVGIGSFKPDMREFPEELFHLLETVYVDTEDALEETGDLITPLNEGWIRREQVRPLGELIQQRRSATDQPGERPYTTLFKSVGMALFDLYAARLIYEEALRKGLGQEVAL